MMMNINEVMDNMQAIFNNREAEIAQLKEQLAHKENALEEMGFELERISIRLERAEEELCKAKSRNRPDYGLRSFSDYNGKIWFLGPDVVANMGFKSSQSSKVVLDNRVHLGTTRKFSYRELVGRVENPPHVGAYCVDKRGMLECMKVKCKKC